MKRLIIGLIALISATVQAKDTLPDYFQATYDGYYEGEKVGEMVRVFKKVGDNYTIISDSRIKGVYGIIPVSDNRHETSLFKINESMEYLPIHYKMERTGTWLDFVMEANFDYKTNNIHMTYKDRVADKKIVGNILDNALYQLRFQHEVKNGSKEIKYDIAYKTGFKNFHFIYENNEKVNMYGKDIELMKFKQVRKNKSGEKKAAYSWVDPNRDFIMTQFVYYNKKGKEEAKFKLREYKKL